MKRLYILTLLTFTAAVSIFIFKPRPATTIASGEGLVIPREWLETTQNRKTPAADVRPADQTFLTFPEWFLVFSPEEMADYYQRSTSTTFPFNSHTAQIWDSYKIVNDQIKDNFPPNPGYHVMIWVIGVSSSVEYTVKAWYELVVGRLTDTCTPKTHEDLFNAHFTQDYVIFIKDRPWYEFDFQTKLQDLWTKTSFTGNHLLRKIERKYMLTSELIVKYAYGKLIGIGTDQVYVEALPTTAVVIDNDSLISLPRYDKFAGAATALSLNGHSFSEIAGNTSAILISAMMPYQATFKIDNTAILFQQPVASDPSLKRVVFATPVKSLSAVLQTMHNQKITLEHVFDY